MTGFSQGRVLRRGGVSFRVSDRAVFTVTTLVAAIFAIGIWSISAGDFPISIAEVFQSLTGNGTKSHDFIVYSLRMPRLLTGVLVGAAFGMSGAIFQSLARNPLASPDIIGFNSGAALGAVTMIIVFNAAGLLVTFGATIGGMMTAALVFLLSWQRGISPYRLVLVGIGVGFTAYAGVDFLMTRSDIFAAAQATQWLTGSLNARVWRDVYVTGIGLAVLAPIAMYLQLALNRLEMGEELAAALGIRINMVRGLISLIGVLLVSLAVAAAGPIAFVALVSGPIARRLTDSSGPCLGTAALVGSLVLVSADLAGRQLFAPTQLPAGVFTAVLGAPFLLWLLATQIRKGAL